MMTDPSHPTVTIVGAGMAGLTAALHLAERGYEVTIYEKEGTAGGNLGASEHSFDPETGIRGSFEVFPHMFGDWYVNFFDLVERRLSLRRDDFEHCPNFGFMNTGKEQKFTHIVNGGSPTTFLENMFSGVETPQDTFLAIYAILEILTRDFSNPGLFSEQTLNGFLASKAYATPGMLKIFDREMLYIWAINSYITSIHAYQNFAKYQGARPVPSNWSLNGSSYQKVIKPLVELLQTASSSHHPVKFVFGATVIGITAPGGQVKRICVRYEKDRILHDIIPVENLILAVPPSALGPLVTVTAEEAMNSQLTASAANTVVASVPGLAQTRLLDSGPLATLYVPLRRKFPFIPTYYVALVDSPAALTYIARPYLAKQLKVKEVLAIGISNVSAIPAWQGSGPTDGPAARLHRKDKIPEDPLHEDEAHHNEIPEDEILEDDIHDDWRHPEHRREIALQVLLELVQYIPQKYNDEFWESIIGDKIYLKANNTQKLFLNSVGSRANAPPTHCPELPNLYFATGANDNPIEIATVECAVIGGMMAAQALWTQDPSSNGNTICPINPLVPAQHDWPGLLALKIALTPWAVAAKSWAAAENICEANGGGLMNWLDPALRTLWGASLAPGAIAAEYWTKRFQPQPQTLREPDMRALRMMGSASMLVDMALQVATAPAWYGIEAMWLLADTLSWGRRYSSSGK